MNALLTINEVIDEYDFSLTDRQKQQLIDFVESCPAVIESVLKDLILAAIEVFIIS
jgi:hypothetical protein